MNSLVCDVCENEIISKEDFSELILPIVAINDIKSYKDFLKLQQGKLTLIQRVKSYVTGPSITESLFELIAFYFRSEHITELNNLRNCDICQQKTPFKKKTHLSKPPRHLIIILQRYGECQSMIVSYPLELDLTRLYESGSPGVVYHLYAVITHSGFDDFGHYKCFCKNHVNNNWYRFNDTQVSEINEDKVLNNRAYLLFYEIRDSI